MCSQSSASVESLRPEIIGVNLWTHFPQPLGVVGAAMFKVSGRLLCCIMDGREVPDPGTPDSAVHKA